jgi:hypothetical protein
MTDTQLQAIVEAHEAGTAWAHALKVGDVFLGASPAAVAAGYSDSAKSAFTHAAVDVLEKHTIVTDADSKLVTYQRKDYCIRTFLTESEAMAMKAALDAAFSDHGLFAPIQVEWNEFVERWVVKCHEADATAVYRKSVLITEEIQ